MSERKYSVGVDLGGTSVKFCVLEEGVGAVSEHKMKTDASEGPSHLLDEIVEGILKCESDGIPISGVGIGAPGTVDLARTTITCPPNLPGWDSVNVKEEIQNRLPKQRNIVVDNDANAAAIGSAYYGVAKDIDSFLMVTLGTGVGGAIVMDNKLFRGANGGAGEFGHVIIDYDGYDSKSGIQGVIEAYIGQRYLSEISIKKAAESPSSSINLLEFIEPRTIHDEAVKGDELAIEILAWAGHKLGVALGSIVNILSIPTIVVAGGVANAGDYLLNPAFESLKQNAVRGLTNDLKIIRETRPSQVGMLGAAHLVFE